MSVTNEYRYTFVTKCVKKATMYLEWNMKNLREKKKLISFSWRFHWRSFLKQIQLFFKFYILLRQKSFMYLFLKNLSINFYMHTHFSSPTHVPLIDLKIRLKDLR